LKRLVRNVAVPKRNRLVGSAVFVMLGTTVFAGGSRQLDEVCRSRIEELVMPKCENTWPCVCGFARGKVKDREPLPAGISPRDAQFYNAICDADEEAVRCLLAEGADPCFAFEVGCWEEKRQLVAVAVACGHARVVRELLVRAVPDSCSMQSLVCKAAEAKHLNCLRVLARAGAPLNVRCQSFSQSRYGWGGPSRLCMHGSVLLAAIQRAAAWERTCDEALLLAKELLDAGVDPNIAESIGDARAPHFTPLSWAAHWLQMPIVHFLLQESHQLTDETVAGALREVRNVLQMAAFVDGAATAAELDSGHEIERMLLARLGPHQSMFGCCVSSARAVDTSEIVLPPVAAAPPAPPCCEATVGDMVSSVAPAGGDDEGAHHSHFCHTVGNDCSF